MHYFFFHELQLIMILLLIRNSYMSWGTWFISLKLCVGFYIFDSGLFLLKFIFLFRKKSIDSFTLKRHNSFHNKIIEKPLTVLLPDLWFLNCNKKFESSMIFERAGAPENWPGDELSKLKKLKFWVVTFSQ